MIHDASDEPASGLEELPTEELPQDEFSHPGYDKEWIEQQRRARHHMQLIDGFEELGAVLDVAQRYAKRLNHDSSLLDSYINAVKSRLADLGATDNPQVHPRHRHTATQAAEIASNRGRSIVFIDECGNHRSHDHYFPYFSVAAVVINDEDYANVQQRWRDWRYEYMREPERATHEPKMRMQNLGYSLKNGKSVDVAQSSLNNLLMDLPFHLVASVLDHREFSVQYGRSTVDEFLPRDAYLMSITFALERVAHLLHHGMGDRLARVLADSRERSNDARLQMEYQRLQIEGTLFLAPEWFRHQFDAFMRFLPRTDDEVGLQIADLMARPVAEKYKDPSSSPLRWDVAKAKLYQGGADTRPAWGLKLFPKNHDALGRMLG